MIVSDVAKGAYQLLGRPSQGDLPYNDLLVHVGDVVTGRLLDKALIARNRRMLTSDWVTGTDRTMAVSLFSLTSTQFVPVKVEWRPLNGDTDARPNKIEIVAFEQLDDLGAKANSHESYCAFYNDYATIAFSDLESVIDTRQYRIVYEPLGIRVGVNVSGAGTSIVNGDYRRQGTLNGKNYYILGGYADNYEVASIYWESPTWHVVDINGLPRYDSSDAVATPELITTWESGAGGATPNPTVVLLGSTGLETGLNDIFLSLCKYETALRCLDQVDNDTDKWAAKRDRLRPGFLAIFQQEQDRFTKFNRTQFGNKKVVRQGFRTR